MSPRDNLPGCKINPTSVITLDAESFDGDDRPTDASHHSHDGDTIVLRATPLATRFGTNELGAQEPDIRIVGHAVTDHPQRFARNAGLIADRVYDQNPAGTFFDLINRSCDLVVAETKPGLMAPHTRSDLFRQGRIAHSATLGPIATGRKRP